MSEWVNSSTENITDCLLCERRSSLNITFFISIIPRTAGPYLECFGTTGQREKSNELVIKIHMCFIVSITRLQANVLY